ncbi:3-isopropylmalate dehydratase small subunit [Meiothermus ruber]|uniref:3-isopropylmalate dehydratase small subunit n=1 Tax=Meiothermus ruber (strain ATCC 35948 / DSM 1279 / VKM B-1258 / 21) TaxID=504728 RepID=D3PNT0_MEIRD|nr:3-isopropylmalate dehydratase small subunit [Meiothermus ruber]ADD29475.1 3-isopropylmalate dehydratase, small subunit [Meiothermus ruber DSM 1279]AGK05075.1 3-isopropylmalate dehydratase small subunit [Meiothermus ruber DSM 1279]MCL6529315.1 homoaconitate hydratase [Meiothermus ruber]MCX7802485.1 homoaconitate hydratase [Meiothermus ruber]GAO76397.1 3-isopropylmalate dehydratase small subunit [Meiothermus ruber H328]
MPRVWKFGDAINTDDILPGKYAPFMVGEDKFHTYAFAHIRPDFASNYRPGDILVCGKNTGLGSSREYAPEALRKLGLKAIIAKSYARIFYRNLVNLGIMPFEAPEVVEALQDGDEVELDFEQGILRRGAETFRLRPPPAFLLEALKEGSILEYYRKYGRFPGEGLEG